MGFDFATAYSIPIGLSVLNEYQKVSELNAIISIAMQNFSNASNNIMNVTQSKEKKTMTISQWKWNKPWNESQSFGAQWIYMM